MFQALPITMKKSLPKDAKQIVAAIIVRHKNVNLERKRALVPRCFIVSSYK